MRHIVKYDYSSQLTADKNCGEITNPYVAGYADVIEWNRDTINPFSYQTPFNIRANGWGTYITITKTNEASAITLYYSTNKTDWYEFSEYTTTGSMQSVYFKGNMKDHDTSANLFSVSGGYDIAGNIMSLYLGDGFYEVRDIDFPVSLSFQNDANLKYNSIIINLNSTKEPFGNSMFSGCTNITSSPNICIKHVGDDVFKNMYAGCTSLVNGGQVVISTCGENFAENMFSGCTSLSQFRCLVLNNPYSGSSNPPFNNAFADAGTLAQTTPTFTKNANATWIDSIIPQGWNVQTEI